LRQVVEQLRNAPTRAARQAILQQLSADERQQVVALLRSRARAGGGPCSSDSPTSPATAPADTERAPLVEPDLVEGGSSPAPITNSYVS
jgi:hypothetical protein